MKVLRSLRTGLLLTVVLVLSAACTSPADRAQPAPSTPLAPPSAQSPSPAEPQPPPTATLGPSATAPSSPTPSGAATTLSAPQPAPPSPAPTPPGAPAAAGAPAPPTPIPATPATPKLPQLALEPAFPNAPQGAFTSRPVFLTPVPGAEGWLAIVVQNGKVLIVLSAQGERDVRTFLDITARVSRDGDEEGLLGLAFHPGYAANRQLYVYYSAASPRRSVISRFTARADPSAGSGQALLSADPASEQVVMEVSQPFSNHNGGMLAFGPDGFLYVGLGDGGSGGDPQGHGQNLQTLLGSILRLDVDRQDPGLRYAVPPDNPFVANAPQQGARGEIWAYGFRNPWRFSFDRTTGALWAADVGQNAWEEVDLVRKGGNYGWNVMEGAHCFLPSSGCRTDGLERPVAEYSHNDGCSVTGGYVYRGSAIPALQGAYLYADFCSGRVWALRYDGTRVTEQTQAADSGLSVSSFGEDAAGELFVLAFDGVGVYRVTATGTR